MPISNFLSQPPLKKELKEYFIEANRGIFPSDTLNCVAHLILCIDTPNEISNIALDYLILKLSADRANLGFVETSDKYYKPASIRNNHICPTKNEAGFVFSNQSKIFQKALKQHSAVVCNDVSVSSLLCDSRVSFESIKSRSMLIQRLTINGKLVGLACVDFTNQQHEWDSKEILFMESFCDTFLGPVLGISQHWYKPNKLQSHKKPSTCELAAIRLAAKGLSYKRISNDLGKSVRTIENQLRNARNNLEATNLPELINKCEIWL
ncbi:MAG: LuxR C-terminal-related transcriptional regulator [Methylophilaceae bacterium]